MQSCALMQPQMQYLISNLSGAQAAGQLLALLLQPMHFALHLCSFLLKLVLLLLLQQVQLCHLAVASVNEPED